MTRLYSILFAFFFFNSIFAQNYKILKVGGNKEILYLGKSLKTGDVIPDLSKIKWLSNTSWIKYFDTRKRVIAFYNSTGKTVKNQSELVVNHELSCKTDYVDKSISDKNFVFKGVSLQEGDKIAMMFYDYEHHEYIAKYAIPYVNANGDMEVFVSHEVFPEIKPNKGIYLPFYLVRDGNFHFLRKEVVWNK